MKRSIAFFAAVLTAVSLQAESIKLKDGTILSGSILSQTQYTLNLATSYGTVTLNQKEIEQILPDKHRILLKGGTQLVGVILDLDEFNLKLQTDTGVVNIDMPQIANIEVYDYDQGQKQQQQYVEQKIETAAQAAQKGLTPTQYGKQYMKQLQQALLKSDLYVMGQKNEDPADRALTAQVTASSQKPGYEAAMVITGVTRREGDARRFT